MPFYICSNCLWMADCDICECCGSNAAIALEYKPSEKQHHYRVYAEGLYVGEVYRTIANFEGETYHRLNPAARANGELVIEEVTRKHTYSPKNMMGHKFMLWTFRGNKEPMFTTWEEVTKALFVERGFHDGNSH